MKKLWIGTFTLISILVPAYSQGLLEQLNQIDQLEKMSPEQYLSDSGKIRIDIENYFVKKEKVCVGEFSVLVLDENLRPSDIPESQISDENKMSCYMELKQLQLKYFKTLNSAHKKAITFMHNKEIRKLEDDHLKIIEDLEKHYSLLELKIKQNSKKSRSIIKAQKPDKI